MRRSSLRMRLALWSAALAGSALLGFALLSSWLIYQAKLDRLDARLERAVPLGRAGELPRPGADLEALLAKDLGFSDPADVALLVIGRDGQEGYRSPQWPGSTASIAQLVLPNPGSFRRGPRVITTLRTPHGTWRVGVRATPIGTVAIAANLAALGDEMATLRRIYLITIPGLLLAIGGGAWGLAGQALKPVRQLGQTIDQVTARGLAQRVPAGGDPEFAALIAAFNAMLERLERSFRQATRFSGDAAHELKTPLTILQGELEQAIYQLPPGSATQQTLSQLLDQVRHLSSIVRKLLLLSLADAGQMSIQHRAVDLSTLVEDQLEDLSLLAPELTLDAAIAPGLRVSGDRDLLAQVLQNLITNAAKYNLPQGWVRVEAQRQGDQARVTVANATIPLTATERQYLFERFYRGEGDRAHRAEGLGLGLSLAREIARAHGGDLRLDPGPPGEARFSLYLPCPAPQPSPELMPKIRDM